MPAGVFMGLTDNRELVALLEETLQGLFGKSIRERQMDNAFNWRCEQADYSAFEDLAYTRKPCRR